MIPRNLSAESAGVTAWQELEFGAATILALAELCKRAIIDPPSSDISLDGLSNEAKAILLCGGNRGVIDIRACKDDYDSVERFLAVCVETEPDSHLLFLQKDEPAQTVAFLEGFAELCRAGLIVHHLGRDFSFSKMGYEFAKRVAESGCAKSLEPQVDFAVKLDH